LLCSFLEGWHAFLGSPYSHLLHRIRAAGFGTNFRVSIQQEGHKNRGADLCTCTGNSGTNFEEFGSDFEVETWHSFRDKSVFNF
jgi:hypothetical protein